MENRRIQSIGGSSFSLILPKKWIEMHRLKNKDEISIEQQKSGRLVLLPASKKVVHRHKISISELEGEELLREVIVLYILGFEEVELTGHPISLKQKQVVRKATYKLAGMEIIEETGEYIFLKSFLDPSKFSFKEYLGKIFLMTRIMFNDAIKAFLEKNQDLAEDVFERDLEINKINFLISRMKHSLMLGTALEEAVNASLVEADYYESVSRQLERIADHAKKIAGLKHSQTKNPGLDKVLVTSCEKINLFLQDAERFTKAVDKKAANKVLRGIFESSPHRAAVHDQAAKQGHGPNLVLIDSLDRISGYIVNMAEFTLAQAAAVPKD